METYTMIPLSKEDEILKDFLEELHKMNFNSDNCTFYRDEEGDTVYTIKNEDIPKPIKLIFEN